MRVAYSSYRRLDRVAELINEMHCCTVGCSVLSLFPYTSHAPNIFPAPTNLIIKLDLLFNTYHTSPACQVMRWKRNWGYVIALLKCSQHLQSCCWSFLRVPLLKLYPPRDVLQSLKDVQVIKKNKTSVIVKNGMLNIKFHTFSVNFLTGFTNLVLFPQKVIWALHC